MKKFAKSISLLSLITAFSLLCGCTRIPSYSEPDTSLTGSGGESNSGGRPSVDYHEAGLTEFTVQQNDFITKLNAESSVHDGAHKDDGEFDGSGYVRLHEGNTMEHILMANTTQFYRIVLAARSSAGAAVSLRADGKVIGTYYIPKSTPSEDGSIPFEYSEVNCLYFSAGTNNLKFVVESGSLDVDYILAESSSRAGDELYMVGSACANPYCSLKTVEVVRYFSEIYGRSVLTAQNVSPASNAEIDAVYRATGRYPAIRSGEIAYATLDSDEDKARVKAETDIAVGWCKAGGLQSYIWHWYSPNIRKSVDAGDFNINIALENQFIDEIALLTEKDITDMAANGSISSELVSLLRDIDKMAEFLKPFDEADAAILFQPLPDGDSGSYWWGYNAENYKKLWTLVFERLCSYHKLHSLIWVWNGSDLDYYPGSTYVDVIGQSFFESSDSSFASRFQGLGSTLPSNKMMAVGSCDVMPNIDYMYRDNAVWLWTAPAAGDYTLNMNGALSETYNSVTYMKNFYNHQKTITLDELPEFN